MFPTREGANIPAHLNWGGWDDCPPAPEHVALLRHWRRVYGAELVTLTGDVLEFRPTIPVRDPEAAKRLAQEWFAPSRDNLTRGLDRLRRSRSVSSAQSFGSPCRTDAPPGENASDSAAAQESDGSHSERTE